MIPNKLQIKRNINVLRTFLLLLIGFCLSNTSNAQVAWDSFYADNVQTCLRAEKVVVQVSIGTSTTGSYIEAKLPAGFNYAGLVSSANSNGSVSYGGEVAGWHRYNLTFTSTAPSVVKVIFNQFPTCDAGTASFTTRDSFRFNNTFTTVNQAGLAFNGTAPDLSITGITHSPTTATIGSVISRSYTVTNGGFGATKDFIIVDKANIGGEYTINTSTFKINPSGVNYTIPAAQITTVGDSIIVTFDTAAISKISDLDTMFENGENFILAYDLTVNTCTPSSILTNLLASWRCPNTSRCTYYDVATGISTFGPAAPNIVSAGPKKRRAICYDGTTIWRDTIRLRNTGGPASNLKFDATTGYYSVQSRTTGSASYFDTASFKVKINDTGAWFKPAYTVTQTVTSGNASAGCNYVGRPVQISYTIPTLGSGDTIYVIIGQVLCNVQYSCVPSNSVQNVVSAWGTAVNVGYQNACASATYPSAWHVGEPYRTVETNFINTGPGSIGDGESKDLSFDIANLANRNYIAKGNFQIIVKLPGVIVFDPAFTNPVYFEFGGNNYYPHSRNGDTFTFRSSASFGSVGTQLHIQSRGLCDGVTCSGLLQYDVEYNFNPDTTSCSTRNRKVCVQYPIAWTTSCIATCCPEGMVNKIYTLNRINYGQGDDNNDGMPSGALDLSLINTKRTIPGDTIEVVHKSVILTSTAFPSFEYLRSIMNVGSTTYYSVISDSVWVDRADSRPDSVFNHTPYALSGTSYVTDLSFMDTFKQGDTITIKLKLRVISNPVGSFHSYSSRVNGGASRDNFVTNKACGAIIDQQNIYGIDNFAYSAGQGTSEGCANRTYIAYNYFRITGGNDRYTNYKFPYEYRPFAEVKQMRVSLPKGWIVDSLEFSSVYNKNSYLPVPSGTNLPFTMLNDTLVSWRPGAFMASEGGTQLPLDEGHLWVYHLRLSPSCKIKNTVFENAPVSDSIVKIASLHRHSYPFSAPHPGGFLRNIQPTITVSSATPVTPSYGKVVSWPLAVNNLATFAAVRNWLYFTNTSGDIIIDSIKQGATVISPDANGFFRIGDVAANGTNNYTIFAKSNACTFDSLYAYPGYSCGPYPTAFTADLCSKAPVPLYVQPQVAAIQTAVTALASTPSDPSNSGSAAYGSSTVDMCQSFPIEMVVQSTQTGTLFDVREDMILPTNFGNVGLDYVPDSGYIEYPQGTAPRKFGWRGDSAILATVASGEMRLLLNLIDSVNFNSTTMGLKGTGTATGNNERIATLRWKMKPNCNLVSGDQFTATQYAKSPCGDTAAGNADKVSGFGLNLTGVSRPYVAAVSVNSSPDACGPFTTAIAIQKIGTTASLPNDSVYIRLPHTVANGNVSCLGVNCPAGTVPYATDSFAAYKIIKFPFPSGLTTGDTLRYEFPTQSKKKSGCETGQEIKADVFQKVTVLCSGTACPNASVSLGTGNVIFDLEKPDLSIMNYNAANNYPYGAPYKYVYWGEIMNTASVGTGTNLSLKTFFDLNQNGTYDKATDSLIKTTTIAGPIAGGSSISFADSFTSPTAKPDPSRPLYSVLDTGDAAANCFCAGIAPSTFLNALPVDWISFTALNLENQTGRLDWSTASEINTLLYDVYRSIDGVNFIKVGKVDANGTTQQTSNYTFNDAITALPGGNIFYKLKQVDQNGTFTWSDVKQILKTAPTGTISIMPNPASDAVQLNYNDVEIGNYQISIIDATGKLVLNQSIQINGSAGSQYLNVSQLSAGIYTISFNGIARKLVIKK